MSTMPALSPPDLPLLTSAKRFRAWLNMLFVDHSIFRFIYNTRLKVTPELHRCGHPMPYQLRAAQRAGIQTVLSLRGNETHLGSNQLEWDTCKRIGLRLVHFPIGSRQEPSREQVLAMVAEHVDLAADALDGAGGSAGPQVVQPHRMTGDRCDLRDTGAHGTGPDHGNCCSRLHAEFPANGVINASIWLVKA